MTHVNASEDRFNKLLKNQSGVVWPEPPNRTKHQFPKRMVARGLVQQEKDAA